MERNFFAVFNISFCAESLQEEAEINLCLIAASVCNSNFVSKNAAVLFHTYTSFHYRAMFYCLYQSYLVSNPAMLSPFKVGL